MSEFTWAYIPNRIAPTKPVLPYQQLLCNSLLAKFTEFTRSVSLLPLVQGSSVMAFETTAIAGCVWADRSTRQWFRACRFCHVSAHHVHLSWSFVEPMVKICPTRLGLVPNQLACETNISWLCSDCTGSGSGWLGGVGASTVPVQSAACVVMVAVWQWVH